MRKLTLLFLICCLAAFGCKKSEDQTSDPIFESAAQQPTASTLESTASTSTSGGPGPEITATESTVAVLPRSDFPVYSATDTDIFAPPRRAEYVYLVDTFYEWPDHIVKWVQAKTPGLDEFQMKNRDSVIARRAREGYEVQKRFTIPAMRTSSPHPLFSYKHTVIIYRKLKT